MRLDRSWEEGTGKVLMKRVGLWAGTKFGRGPLLRLSGWGIFDGSSLAHGVLQGGERPE